MLGVSVMATAYICDVARSGFGEWLDQRMIDMPITQARLAKLSGVSEGQLSRYRAGQTIPDPATLRKLAKPLDADFDEMMVLAGHTPGDTKSAGRMFVVSTDDPRVHRLYKILDAAEDVSEDDIARAEDVLKALFRHKDS